MTKEELQENAICSLINDKRLILQWATSLGKGYTAVRAVSRIKPEKALLVVAETLHKDNWRKEFADFGAEYLYDRMTVECYASLKNYRDTVWDLIIFDEAHHLGSDLRMDILQSLKAERVLALSATLSDASLVSLLNITFGTFKISSISIQSAIENNWLPEPKIFTIPLKLSTSGYTETIVEEWGNAKKRIRYECTWEQRWAYLKNKKTLYPNATLIIHCTQYQKYSYLSEQFEFWKKRYFVLKNEAIKAKWLQFGTKRKVFMGSLKTDIVRRFLTTISDKKFICFCTNIEQADILGGNNAIHSKSKTNDSVLNDFNNNKIKNLFVVGMAQEGQNLAGIEVGVLVQLDGKERAFIQKFGRAMRAEDPVQYIFYFKDTRDEEYLKNVLEGINPAYIKELTL